MWNHKQYFQYDLGSFNTFKNEIEFKRPQIHITKTPNGSTYDALIDGHIAVEIKTRPTCDLNKIISYGGTILFNNNKLKRLRELKGLTSFEGLAIDKVYIAYILKDVYLLIDIDNMCIKETKTITTANPGKEDLWDEECAFIDITQEKKYNRVS